MSFRTVIVQHYVSATDLLSSQGCLVHDRAYMSLSASEAMVAFLNMDQAKSHSSTPPAAIALQYTVVFKLGLILERLWKVTKCLRQWQQWQGKDSSGKHISERTCCVLGRSSTLWTSLWSAPYSLPLQCCRLRRLHSPGCTWTGTWHDMIWYKAQQSEWFKKRSDSESHIWWSQVCKPMRREIGPCVWDGSLPLTVVLFYMTDFEGSCFSAEDFK